MPPVDLPPANQRAALALIALSALVTTLFVTFCILRFA
jgi:hypothetical protein